VDETGAMDWVGLAVELGAFVGLMEFADRHAMHARSAGAEGRVALATEHWVRALACLEEAGERGRRFRSAVVSPGGVRAGARSG